MVRLLVVFLLFALSVSILYFSSQLPLSPFPSFLSVCRIFPMVSSTRVLVYLPSHSPHAVAVDWREFLVYGRGCGCCGDILKIVGYWLAAEEEEVLAGLQKSSELSVHQILVGGECGQILRAELSSNSSRRFDRRSYSTLHQSWLWELYYYYYY